jgi:hypothetical protein
MDTPKATTNLRFRVVSNAVEVRCPECRTRHKAREISLAPPHGDSYCDSCITRLASPAEVITIAALNALDDEVWGASLIADKGNGASRTDLARLVNAATTHIISKRLT